MRGMCRTRGTMSGVQKTTSGMRRATARFALTGPLGLLALGSLSLTVLLPVVLLVELGSALPTSGIEPDPFLVTLTITAGGTLLIGAATLWWIEAVHSSPDRYGGSDRSARS